MNDPKMINRFVVDLTPAANGGESFCFIGDIWDNGDGNADGVYMVSSFVLNSYGCEAKISGSLVTPNKLRQLADQIEREINKAKYKMEHED